MRKIILILTLIIFMFACNQGQKEIVTIGENRWFTEYGYSKALEKAGKENKPILAYFTAKWCAPCQKMKKDIFEKKEFKKVAKKVVLLRVEQTEGLGQMLCKKFKIIAYPAIRLIDSNGNIIDRGWNGERGKTVKDIEEWINLSMEKTNPDFYKKPMPLNRVYNFVKNPFTTFYRFPLKNRFEILKNSLVFYANNLKNKTDNHAYFQVLITFIYEVSSLYENQKTEKEKKEFLKKNDPLVSMLLSKLKNRKERDYWTAKYLTLTGRAEKAFVYTERYTKNIKKIDDISLKFLLLKMNLYLFYAKDSSKIQEGPSNLLKEYNIEKGLGIFNRMMELVLKKRDNKIRNAVFSNSINTIKKLAKNNEKKLAEIMAKKAFETLISMDNLKNCEIFKKKIDFSNDSFEPQSFWINVYLDKFSDLELVPETIVDFCKKNYRDVNISYQIEYANFVIRNYFAMGEYKEGMEFINKVLKDKEFMERQSKVWWEYSLYNEIAYQLLKHNINIEFAGKYAKKACELRNYNEPFSLYVLALYRAKKGDYFDAIQLATKAYNMELCETHPYKKFLEVVKQKIEEWKEKSK